VASVALNPAASADSNRSVSVLPCHPASSGPGSEEPAPFSTVRLRLTSTSRSRLASTPWLWLPSAPRLRHSSAVRLGFVVPSTGAGPAFRLRPFRPPKSPFRLWPSCAGLPLFRVPTHPDPLAPVCLGPLGSGEGSRPFALGGALTLTGLLGRIPSGRWLSGPLSFLRASVGAPCGALRSARRPEGRVRSFPTFGTGPFRTPRSPFRSRPFGRGDLAPVVSAGSGSPGPCGPGFIRPGHPSLPRRSVPVRPGFRRARSVPGRPDSADPGNPTSTCQWLRLRFPFPGPRPAPDRSVRRENSLRAGRRARTMEDDDDASSEAPRTEIRDPACAAIVQAEPNRSGACGRIMTAGRLCGRLQCLRRRRPASRSTLVLTLLAWSVLWSLQPNSCVVSRSRGCGPRRR
jgi:hypothetical protein